MGLLDFLLFGAFLNSLRNNNQSNNSPTAMMTGTWIMMTINAMMIMIVVTDVTATVTLTISLIFDY